MILLFAPLFHPILINSVLVIPVPGPVFGTALVAHLSYSQLFRGENKCKKLQHSVTARTNIQYVHTFYRVDALEEKLPYGNTPILSKVLKLMLLVTFCYSVISISYHTQWTYESLCNQCFKVYVQKKISLIWNYCKNYAVTLSPTCTVYYQLTDHFSVWVLHSHVEAGIIFLL